MADGSVIVQAPSGWGFLPGVILSGDPASALPTLPLLAQLSPADRTHAVAEAIQSVPGLLSRLQPRDLRARYGLPQATASDVLSRLRGEPVADAGAMSIADRILRILGEGPATTGEIAAELGMKSKLAATHLLRLQQCGKVAREPYSCPVTPGRQLWLWRLANG